MPNQSDLPRLWKKGDRFSSAHLNEAVEVARRIANLSGDGRNITFPNGSVSDQESYQVSEFIIGLLTNAGPSGEPDFANEMYWVKAAYLVTLPAGDPGTTPALYKPHDIAANYMPYPAMVTNLAEVVNHTHILSPLDETLPVVFWAQYDDTGIPQYVMHEGSALPRGQYQEMVLKQATQNSAPVFGFVLGHGML
jgi:hypothetical protein